MFLSPTRSPVLLLSCGQETLSGVDPSLGGLCSKKRTRLFLSRVAGPWGKAEGARPATAGSSFLFLQFLLPPFLVIAWLPLLGAPELTAHFLSSPNSCSPPHHLRGPGSLGGSPACRLLLPRVLASAATRPGLSSATALSSHSNALSPLPQKGPSIPGTWQAIVK